MRFSFFGQNEALIALEILSLLSLSVADPGVPRGEGAKFSQKLHEMERIWTLEGGRRASKILLCRSATDYAHEHGSVY